MPEKETMSSALEEFFDKFFGIVRHTQGPIGSESFRYAITQWGDNLIPSGLEMMISNLRYLVIVTAGMDEIEGGKLIQSVGIKYLSAFQDIIVELGTKGLDRLIESLSDSNEDVASLAALGLSTDALTTNKALQPLSQAFHRSYGTGFKLATAIALLVHGEVEPIKSVAVPYLAEESRLSTMIDLYKRSHLFTNQKKMDLVVYKQMVFPIGLALVLWDIATKGSAPKEIYPTWKKA